jgi:hypothetical protein
MLHQGRKYISLGRAAKLLGMHYRTLVRQLEKPDNAGFEVYEEQTRNGKRLRYLPLEDVRRAAGMTGDAHDAAAVAGNSREGGERR